VFFLDPNNRRYVTFHAPCIYAVYVSPVTRDCASFLVFSLHIHAHPRVGVDPRVDRGTFPLLFEMKGRPVFCPPTFSGVDIFCTNGHGIHWMIGAIFVKFCQLVLMKIIKIVATRCEILRLKCTKSNFGRSFAPHPAGGSSQRSSRPPSWL